MSELPVPFYGRNKCGCHSYAFAICVAIELHIESTNMVVFLVDLSWMVVSRPIYYVAHIDTSWIKSRITSEFLLYQVAHELVSLQAFPVVKSDDVVCAKFQTTYFAFDDRQRQVFVICYS